MIIDGKAIAAQKLEDLKSKIKDLKIKPKLAIVMVGGDPATEIYVRLKREAADRVGIETEVVGSIDKVSLDADGIILQLPYPNSVEAIAQIPPEKDVDGLTGRGKFLPATVKAILTLSGELVGKTVVVVGQGRLVGKPLADYLEKQNVNVVRCDEFTEDLKTETLKADILVVATGKEKLITAEMVKPGAIVIDCGSPKAEVDFENVKNVASAITPVPGGVGPLTVVSLLENTVEAAIIGASNMASGN